MTIPFFFTPNVKGDLDDQINEMYRLKHEKLAAEYEAEVERLNRTSDQFPDLEIRDRCIWNLWFNKTPKPKIAAMFGVSVDRVQKVLRRAKKDGKYWHKREDARDVVQEFGLANCSLPMLESRIALLQALADYEWSK